MNKFVLPLKEEVYALLDELEKREDDILKKAQEGAQLMETAIEKMKEFITGYKFIDEQEEISFFKEVKPRLSCLLIFYRSVYLIEINRPQGGRQAQIAYLKGELDKLSGYFEENKYYYHYYRSGDCSLDRLYFLRGKPTPGAHTDIFYFERDPSFATNCDFKMSEILANDMLESHLVVEIDKLEGKDYGDVYPASGLLWTLSKSDLCEIAISLYLLESFNGGHITQKEYMKRIGQAFNIELDNFSRVLYDLNIRNNPTRFLDKLKEALTDYLKNSNNKFNNKTIKDIR
ncbi:RteC protein [Dysgonomonas sp. 216]|uniref:RteC domain-containing protein n=1 Tax=Dysgonomonas sp. 216 TaxID=2302934 RepID=UPI0013D6823A|nr:RteC domain-containing protein [Dysgonomonas sp. 216]NDW18735.1 RteC protein [Dysgonomonas sp. 216]